MSEIDSTMDSAALRISAMFFWRAPRLLSVRDHVDYGGHHEYRAFGAINVGGMQPVSTRAGDECGASVWFRGPLGRQG